jgi:hypothetical protein
MATSPEKTADKKVGITHEKICQSVSNILLPSAEGYYIPSSAVAGGMTPAR